MQTVGPTPNLPAPWQTSIPPQSNVDEPRLTRCVAHLSIRLERHIAPSYPPTAPSCIKDRLVEGGLVVGGNVGCNQYQRGGMQSKGQCHIITPHIIGSCTCLMGSRPASAGTRQQVDNTSNTQGPTTGCMNTALTAQLCLQMTVVHLHPPTCHQQKP